MPSSNNDRRLWPAQRYALARRLFEHLRRGAPSEEGLPGADVQLPAATPFEQGYAAALGDLLALLGALDARSDRLVARPGSVAAGYLLGLLADLTDAREPLISDWHREGLAAPGMPPAAVDVLAAIEQRRLQQLPQAQPVRHIRAALALIERPDEPPPRAYLCVYDTGARMWQLPGGRYEQRDGTLRATLLRELSEELGCGPLREPDDLVASERGAPFWIDRVSPTYGILTRTWFQLYDVRFTRELPVSGPHVRWVRLDEALAGCTGGESPEPVAADMLRRLVQEGCL